MIEDIDFEQTSIFKVSKKIGMMKAVNLIHDLSKGDTIQVSNMGLIGDNVLEVLNVATRAAMEGVVLTSLDGLMVKPSKDMNAEEEYDQVVHVLNKSGAFFGCEVVRAQEHQIYAQEKVRFLRPETDENFYLMNLGVAQIIVPKEWFPALVDEVLRFKKEIESLDGLSDIKLDKDKVVPPPPEPPPCRETIPIFNWGKR